MRATYKFYIRYKQYASVSLTYKLQGNTFCDIISSFKHLYDLYVELDEAAYKDLDNLYKLWKHNLQWNLEGQHKS